MQKFSKKQIAVALALLLALTGCSGEAALTEETADVEPAAEATPLPEVVITDIGPEAMPTAEVGDLPDYSSTEGDVNALYVGDGAQALSGILVHKTGDALSGAEAGRNAAILVEGQELTLGEATVFSGGKQAEGMVVLGNTANVFAENISIHTDGEASPGIRLLDGARAQIGQSSISTHLASSPAMQICGSFFAADSKFRAEAGPCLILENGTNAEFSHCELIGKAGILYRDSSPAGRKGRILMENSLFAAEDICILQMEQGDLELHLRGQQLSGKLNTGSGSLTMILEGKSVFCGVFEGEDPRSTTLVLDSGSIWTITEDTRIGVLLDTDSSLSNIASNGFTVYYDSSLEQNAWLESKSHSLPGGGYLIPLI